MVDAAMEMPRYTCHKRVWALKIGYLEGFTLVPEDTRYAPIDVGREYFDKHNPKSGGYYVVYEDGYKSFSPAEAFEAGYTLEAIGIVGDTAIGTLIS